jgi:hypothetical protein
MPDPAPPPRPETPEERRERRATETRARAAIRMRQDAEARARIGLAAKLETDRRLADEREWLATHKAPTQGEIETLRKMFPNLNKKDKRR